MTEGIGAEIGEVKASLRVFGPELDPERVSATLRCEPTRSWRRGDPHPKVKGRTSEMGMWQVDSGLGRDRPLVEHLRAILAATTEDLAAWKQLSSEFECDLFLGGTVADLNSWIVLPHDVMKALGDRGVELVFDLYVDDQLLEP